MRTGSTYDQDAALVQRSRRPAPADRATPRQQRHTGEHHHAQWALRSIFAGSVLPSMVEWRDG
jgi:hypothetical protein